MNDELFSQASGHIDATIIVKGQYDASGAKTVTVTWQGGETAGISKELMDDADGRLLQRNGDTVVAGDLRLHIVGFDGRTYLVRRMSDEEARQDFIDGLADVFRFAGASVTVSKDGVKADFTAVDKLEGNAE